MGNKPVKSETSREHDLPELTQHSYAEALRLYYKTKVLPTELRTSYDVYGTPPLLDAEFLCPPALLVVGEYSVGKTTAINHILNHEYAGSRTGPEPTTDSFFILMYGAEHCSLPATTMINDQTFPYQGMSRLGNVFLNKCFIIFCPVPLLKHLIIIDTPGLLSGEKQVRTRPYDYEVAMNFFAEKADRILFMFDAIKLDINEEIKRQLLAFQQYEEKILFMMNKADSCDAIKFHQVRACLTWALSRTLKTVEAPRLYCGSLWDHPMRFMDNRELFDQDMRALFYELRYLTYSIHVRRLSEVAQRAAQVRIFAFIANEIHDNFLNCCIKYQKKRIAASLEGEIYPEVIRQHRVSTLDMPPIPAMQRLILSSSADPLPRVKLSAIRALEEFITIDVHRFMEVLPPEGSICADYGRLDDSALYMNSDHMDWCVVTEDAEKHGWRAEFRQMRPVDGRVGPKQVTAIMEGSGLSRPVLDQIWRLVDDDNDGLINEDEFCLIKYLLKRTVLGYSVPFELSDRMRPPRNHIPRHCEQLYRQMRQVERYLIEHRNLRIPPALRVPTRWDFNQKEADLEDVAARSKIVVGRIVQKYNR